MFEKIISRDINDFKPVKLDRDLLVTWKIQNYGIGEVPLFTRIVEEL